MNILPILWGKDDMYYKMSIWDYGHLILWLLYFNMPLQSLEEVSCTLFTPVFFDHGPFFNSIFYWYTLLLNMLLWEVEVKHAPC